MEVIALGGSWLHHPDRVPRIFRFISEHRKEYYYIGFRVARTPLQRVAR